MALTPADILNKRFQATKFREGYDQEEVDDFLDEIVVEMRRLTEENEDLRRQLAQAGHSGEVGTEAQPGVVGREAALTDLDPDTVLPVDSDGTEDTAADWGVPTGEDTTVTTAEPTSTELHGSDATAEVSTSEQTATAEPTLTELETPADSSTDTTASTTTAPAAAAAPAASESATSAAAVLAMAQRLHDELVAEGETRREEIITGAQREADVLVSDAQETSRRTLADLEDQRSVLQLKVDQLQDFERDYRDRLRAYIQGQLQDLDSQDTVEEETSADRA